MIDDVTYAVRPMYTDGKRQSPVLHELIGDEITINPDFVAGKLTFTNGDRRHHHAIREHATPFEEIRMMPHGVVYGDRPPFVPDKSVTRTDYVEAFERAVSRAWDTDKFNLIFHSSGFDSRLIGYFARREYKRRGGRVLMVCIGDECKSFIDMMEYEGWYEDQYAVISHDDIYRFDFDNVWRHVNGGGWRFCASMYHSAFDYLMDNGCLPSSPDDISVWTGLGNNESVSWSGDLYGNRERMYYGWQMRMWGNIGGVDTVQPCMDEGVGRALFSFPDRNDNRGKFRRKMVETADAKLAAFPRLLTTKPAVGLADLKRMVDDFKSSYYYNEIDRCRYPNFIDGMMIYNGRYRGYHMFCQKWTVASLVENLIRKGVNVKWRKKSQD